MGNKQGKSYNLIDTIINDYLFPFALFVFFFSLGIRFVFCSRVPYFVVPTMSMYPTISPGDILFCEGWDIENIKPGDIIVFRAFDARTKTWMWVVHRVKEIKEINGSKYIITAGDFNVEQCKKRGYPEYLCYDNGTLYPDTGILLKRCPLMGQIKEFCIAGKVISIGGWLIKIPYIGKIAIYLHKI